MLCIAFHTFTNYSIRPTACEASEQERILIWNQKLNKTAESKCHTRKKKKNPLTCARNIFTKNKKKNIVLDPILLPCSVAILLWICVCAKARQQDEIRVLSSFNLFYSRSKGTYPHELRKWNLNYTTFKIHELCLII